MKMKILHTGKIINGEFYAYNTEMYDFTRLEFEGKEVCVSIEESDPLRSINFNDYLWGCLYYFISKDTGQMPTMIHRDFKKMWGYKTTRTGKKKFKLFTELVRVFAGEFLNLELPLPDKNWRMVA